MDIFELKERQKFEHRLFFLIPTIWSIDRFIYANRNKKWHSTMVWRKKTHEKMLQPSSRLEWEYSCVCVCAYAQLKNVLFSRKFTSKKNYRTMTTHTHTPQWVHKISVFFSKRFFSFYLTHIIPHLMVWWQRQLLHYYYHEFFWLLNSLSLSLFRQLPCSVSSYKIVLPIYRKNDLCLPCGIHSNTHTVCRSVDIAFGDQYTHRDRSTNTPYC